MKLKVLLISALASLTAACSSETTEEATKEPVSNGVVNIYSSRHYDADLDLYDAFTQQSGVKINLIEADADALIERIKSEGEFSPADILLTVDAGRLWRAEQADIFVPVESETLDARVPAEFRHPEKLWFGFASRARIIIYNKDAGKPDALENYADLASPELEGLVCMRSSSNIYNISLLASLISHEGPEAAQDWAAGVVSNFKRNPQGNDTANIQAVASGECGVSLVNSYYLARFYKSDDPAKQKTAEAVGVLFPNQDGRGAHVNISGAGILEHAPNRENAIKFLEFMTTETAQTILSEGNHEYPILDDVAPEAAVWKLGQFKSDELNASQLGTHQTEAVKTFDRAGWN